MGGCVVDVGQALGGGADDALQLVREALAFKGGAITTPSAEALYRRGMLPALAEVQRQAIS
ncbi:hypothetical protein [Streptomyces sp. NPDC087300]|uniref:hypothetical protein n=1 Tax=Streptomyces sp. NPDC087300 TaxID=3365780 RepID=UPI0037F163A5